MCALTRNQECMDSIYANSSEAIRLQMVKIFVKKGLPFSDCDNILLEGLSEANCNEECLRLFHRIREAQKTDKSITLFPHGYSSIVRSACRLKRQKLAEETMETMRSKGMRPLEYAYFELCSVVWWMKGWTIALRLPIVLETQIRCDPAQNESESYRIIARRVDLLHASEA